MVNGMVWGPVVWIPGIPFMKGIVTLGIPWNNPKAPGPKPPINH